MVDTSVLIPVGPHPRPYLERALESVVRDTGDQARLVVVFDGGAPTPREASWLDSHGAHIIRIKKATSLGEVLNVGLRELDTPFVARLDADDLWAPGRLVQQRSLLQKEPEAALVCGDARLIDPDDFPIGEYRSARLHELSHGLLVRNQVIHPSVMMRTQAVSDAGGYPVLPMVEDYLLWLRLAQSHRLIHAEHIWVYYRIHAMQLTRSAMPPAARKAVLRERERLARCQGRPWALTKIRNLAWSVAQRPQSRHARSLWTRARITQPSGVHGGI